MNLQCLRQRAEILGHVIGEVDPGIIFGISHRFADIYNLYAARLRFRLEDIAHKCRLLRRCGLTCWCLFKRKDIPRQRSRGCGKSLSAAARERRVGLCLSVTYREPREPGKESLALVFRC